MSTEDKYVYEVEGFKINDILSFLDRLLDKKYQKKIRQIWEKAQKNYTELREGGEMQYDLHDHYWYSDRAGCDAVPNDYWLDCSVRYMDSYDTIISLFFRKLIDFGTRAKHIPFTPSIPLENTFLSVDDIIAACEDEMFGYEPTSCEEYYQLSQHASKSRRIEYLRKARELKPRSLKVCYALGASLYRIDDYEEAFRLLMAWFIQKKNPDCIHSLDDEIVYGSDAQREYCDNLDIIVSCCKKREYEELYDLMERYRKLQNFDVSDETHRHGDLWQWVDEDGSYIPPWDSGRSSYISERQSIIKREILEYLEKKGIMPVEECNSLEVKR